MKNRRPISDIGEFGLIDRIAKSIKVDASVIKGIGDDAAVIRFTNNRYLLFTTDMLIEGVHFSLREATAYQIGWKALGVVTSDIAAMGGLPRYATISLGLPKGLSLRFIDQLYKGMRGLSVKFKINIVGGDTNRSKKIVVDVALLGEVEKKKLVLRSGAKVGDIIFVSGTLGGSLKKRHLTFLPRLKEARHLVKNYKLNSMIDLSDGLSSDLNQIAKASNVGAIIYEGLIPISRETDSLEAALNEGEDFELLFSLPLNEARRLSSSWKMKVPLVQIGEIVKKSLGLRVITKAGRERRLVPKGFKHF